MSCRGVSGQYHRPAGLRGHVVLGHVAHFALKRIPAVDEVLFAWT
jgi:hypothetical protein